MLQWLPIALIAAGVYWLAKGKEDDKSSENSASSDGSRPASKSRANDRSVDRTGRVERGENDSPRVVAKSVANDAGGVTGDNSSRKQNAAKSNRKTTPVKATEPAPEKEPEPEPEKEKANE